MILDIPLVTDLQLLQKRRQELIDKRLVEANTRRFAHDYAVGDEVLRLIYRPDKMEPRAVGPYRITRVHSNGTITIELSPGVVGRINIRRVKPNTDERRGCIEPMSKLRLTSAVSLFLFCSQNEINGSHHSGCLPELFTKTGV
jgi:hypothetical protein